MIRVGIDGKVLHAEAAGIGRYAYGLLRSILQMQDPQAEDQLAITLFTGPQTSTEFLSALPDAFLRRHSPVRSSVLRALTALPSGVVRETLDVFHGLDHVGIPVLPSRCKYVVTVHDIMPLTHPEWFPLKHRTIVRNALRYVFRHADSITVPSEFVKRDVVRRSLYPSERIVVIPAACDERFHADARRNNLSSIRQRYGLTSPYVLYVGRIEPRKNIPGLLRALATLRDQDFLLALAGAPAWGQDEVMRTIHDLDLASRVRLLGYVPDQFLPALYRGAEALALPSLCEGFGLPVLEAMTCGTPVVASDRGSLPEITRGAALLVDPESVQQIAGSLRSVVQDRRLRETLRTKGLERARDFSWNTSAQRVVRLYVRLASAGPLPYRPSQTVSPSESHEPVVHR